MRTGSDFLGSSSNTEMRHSAVLLVLTKHKQLVCDHFWEAACWPSSLVASLTSGYVLTPACLPHSSCAHTENPSLHAVVFSCWLCWWWLCAHVLLSLKLVTPPTFHGVPLSSPELSFIFSWLCERANEFPSLLAKNWRSVWPSSEKVLMAVHSGTWKAKEITKDYIDMWSLWMLTTWQDQVSPRYSYLCHRLGSVKLMGEMQLGFQ